MERILLAFAGQRVEINALCMTHDANHEMWLHCLFCSNTNSIGEPISVTAYLYDIGQYRALEHQLMEEMEVEQELTNHLRQAQRQLQQSEKLATVGQLAAGVAHEINNPIGYIGSNINTMKSYIEKLRSVVEDSCKLVDSSTNEAELSESTLRATLEKLRAQLKQEDLDYLLEDMSDIVNECSEGVRRVKSIITDMKGVAHSNDDEREWNNIHDAIDMALNIANNEIKYKAVVNKQYSVLPKVFCSSSQMNQIFLNILVNASQAILEWGEITVRTKEIGGSIEIEIEDTGSGIDEEGISKIFDTFYTTKPVGEGTGLGLPIVKEIITRHGGDISVRSQPGEGTCFTILLPIGEEHEFDSNCVKGAA